MIFVASDEHLALQQPWLALALWLAGCDKLQAASDGAQFVVEFLAVVDDPMAAGIVAVEVENGGIVALRLVELRLEEVLHEAVGYVNATRFQPFEGGREIEVLLIEERHFGRHIGG